MIQRRVELLRGAFEDVLGNVRANTLLSDPPFSSKTHKGQRYTRYDGSAGIVTHGLGYDAFTPAHAQAFVDAWAWRIAQWFCVFCSHDLVDTYTRALRRHGRYVYAPLACVLCGQSVRLQGDGPANWTSYLVVARPRTLRHWGALRGAYVGTPYDKGEGSRAERATRGCKPLWLMHELVRDYSTPGGLIVDPCAGRGTTLVAAAQLGRDAIGAEVNPSTYVGALRYVNSQLRGVKQQHVRTPSPPRSNSFGDTGPLGDSSICSGDLACRRNSRRPKNRGTARARVARSTQSKRSEQVDAAPAAPGRVTERSS